jgi:pimeloyl-ACP methyl ester carboxylesterase
LIAASDTSSDNFTRRQLLTGGLALGAGVKLTATSGTDDPIAIPAQAPAKTGLAQLADVKLWYWDTCGDGEPVVLLHPMTGSGLVWPYQQPVLAKSGYRVLGYSRRGFHNSEAGPADKPATGSQDLHELLSVLGIGKFHAVATAGGAFVAADYAVSHPDRLHTLTLACSLLGLEDAELTTLTSRLRTPGFDALPACFRELSPSYRAANGQGTERWNELERTSLSGPRALQPLANRITLASLARLTMPTLLIAGDADLIAPPPVARLFARHIPDCRLEVIPECGHSAYWERPAVFNEIVSGFLRRHARHT